MRLDRIHHQWPSCIDLDLPSQHNFIALASQTRMTFTIRRQTQVEKKRPSVFQPVRSVSLSRLFAALLDFLSPGAHRFWPKHMHSQRGANIHQPLLKPVLSPLFLPSGPRRSSGHHGSLQPGCLRTGLIFCVDCVHMARCRPRLQR